MCNNKRNYNSSDYENLKKDKDLQLKNKESELKEKIEDLKLDDINSNTLNSSEVDLLNKEISRLKKNEYENSLRFHAEIENIKRRSLQDLEKSRKFLLERILNDLIPVIDSLEKALQLVDNNEEKVNINSITKGLELTLKLFLTVVNKYGLKSINEKNIQFDPKKHQAVKILQSDDYNSGIVIDVMQKGYFLNGRLIRPAMVIVSKLKKDN